MEKDMIIYENDLRQYARSPLQGPITPYYDWKVLYGDSIEDEITAGEEEASQTMSTEDEDHVFLCYSCSFICHQFNIYLAFRNISLFLIIVPRNDFFTFSYVILCLYVPHILC